MKQKVEWKKQTKNNMQILTYEVFNCLKRSKFAASYYVYQEITKTYFKMYFW